DFLLLSTERMILLTNFACAESAEQERMLLAKWLKSFCEDCKRILMEEGFIVEEYKQHRENTPS
ncbi:MAG: hypothetical protein QXU43_03690, partial [Thermoproteota archaeon]